MVLELRGEERLNCQQHEIFLLIVQMKKWVQYKQNITNGNSKLAVKQKRIPEGGTSREEKYKKKEKNILTDHKSRTKVVMNMKDRAIDAKEEIGR